MGPERPSSAADLLSTFESTWTVGSLAGLPVCSSGLLTAASLAHAFTLRPANMRLDAGTDAHGATRRRQRLCAALGGQPRQLAFMEQVHGHRIAVVEAAKCSRCIPGVDGLVVHRAGVNLMALSADCPVVAVCDPDRRVLGLAHAGWRGTIRGITRNLVQTMIQRFGCRAEALMAAIAPSAGPCCYEVGDDVARAAASLLPDHDRFLVRRTGSLFFDLWSANAAQLGAAGVGPRRIDLAGWCTICDDRFFSYRRDGAATGHAAMMATLR